MESVKSIRQRKAEKILKLQDQGLYEAATGVFESLKSKEAMKDFLIYMGVNELFSSYEMKLMFNQAYANRL